MQYQYHIGERKKIVKITSLLMFHWRIELPQYRMYYHYFRCHEQVLLYYTLISCIDVTIPFYTMWLFRNLVLQDGCSKFRSYRSRVWGLSFGHLLPHRKIDLGFKARTFALEFTYLKHTQIGHDFKKHRPLLRNTLLQKLSKTHEELRDRPGSDMFSFPLHNMRALYWLI